MGNGDSNKQSVSQLDQFFVSLQIAAIVAIILIVLAFIALFYVAWWNFISTKSLKTVQVWSMVATTFVLFAFGVGAWLGYLFGARKANWQLEGMSQVINKIATSIYNAGIQASDVRVYGFNRLFGRENENSQELDLGRLPILPVNVTDKESENDVVDM